MQQGIRSKKKDEKEDDASFPLYVSSAPQTWSDSEFLCSGITMNRPRRVGMPWYSAKRYDTLRHSLSDGDSLPVLYEAWRISAEQVEREVQRSGVDVVRVPIEPEAFQAWCERTGCTNDGAARSRYAAEVVAGPTKTRSPSDP